MSVLSVSPTFSVDIPIAMSPLGAADKCLPFNLASIHFPFSEIQKAASFKRGGRRSLFSSLTFTASHTGIWKRARVLHSNGGKLPNPSMCHSVCSTLQVSIIAFLRRGRCFHSARLSFFFVCLFFLLKTPPLCSLSEGRVAVALQGRIGLRSASDVFASVGDIFHTTRGSSYLVAMA